LHLPDLVAPEFGIASDSPPHFKYCFTLKIITWYPIKRFLLSPVVQVALD
jgi:hypothetical protein